MLFRKYPGQLLFMALKLLFKGLNKRVHNKIYSKDDIPPELRETYESLLEDKNNNGMPDVFEESEVFRQAIERGDVFITNPNDLDGLPSDAREKHEALKRDQNSGGNYYGSDNLQNENHDVNQTIQNTLDDINDEDVNVVKRNRNNSFSNLFVLFLVVIGLVFLAVRLIS